MSIFAFSGGRCRGQTHLKRIHRHELDTPVSNESPYLSVRNLNRSEAREHRAEAAYPSRLPRGFLRGSGRAYNGHEEHPTPGQRASQVGEGLREGAREQSSPTGRDSAAQTEEVNGRTPGWLPGFVACFASAPNEPRRGRMRGSPQCHPRYACRPAAQPHASERSMNLPGRTSAPFTRPLIMTPGAANDDAPATQSAPKRSVAPEDSKLLANLLVFYAPEAPRATLPLSSSTARTAPAE